MKTKTEELLYLLLWTAECAARPTLHNLTDSFEAWAYRKGFHRQLRELERQKLVKSKRGPSGARLHCLTEAGRSLAHGPIDPKTRWNRPWDKTWRLVLFDVPQAKASHRARLQRSLADRGFGYLQNSVWITPDPLTDERKSLQAGPVEVESLLLLEARPCAGESDAEIVAGAWNFDAINQSYEDHAQILKGLPQKPLTSEAAAQQLQRWFGDERLAWRKAMHLDPLLPKILHPAGYRGVKAVKQRLKVMAQATRLMRTFQRPY
jgi:phenylacetic acid degradation operon negative regulatory protein